MPGRMSSVMLLRNEGCRPRRLTLFRRFRTRHPSLCTFEPKTGELTTGRNFGFEDFKSRLSQPSALISLRGKNCR